MWVGICFAYCDFIGQFCDIIDNVLEICVCVCCDFIAGNNNNENNPIQHILSLAFTYFYATVSVCVTNNITNMSQVVSVEMEYHLFHRGLVH